MKNKNVYLRIWYDNKIRLVFNRNTQKLRVIVNKGTQKLRIFIAFFALWLYNCN